MQDWKMTDESAGLENAGLENDGRFFFARRIFTPFRRRRISDILSVVVF